MRSAGLPSESIVTPMMRPGMRRAYDMDVAMNAACGPPKPIGTPKRWAEPTAMSAPHSPGGWSLTSASGSVAATTSAFAACALSVKAAYADASHAPYVLGYCTSVPQHFSSVSASSVRQSPTMMSRPTA